MRLIERNENGNANLSNMRLPHDSSVIHPSLLSFIRKIGAQSKESDHRDDDMSQLRSGGELNVAQFAPSPTIVEDRIWQPQLIFVAFDRRNR